MSSSTKPRRSFIKTVGLGAAALGVPRELLAAGAKGRAAARPNILLVIADDLACTDVGCYGNRDVKTPNIDRLASQGMRFDYAFTATAMCAPTRQQLYTGMFPVRNGAYPNHSWVKHGARSIVHHLRALGYRVGLIGKTHFGPPGSFPFERPKDVGEFINRDKGQPYCLVYASSSPHVPWNKKGSVAYVSAKLKIPPYLVNNPETRRCLADYYGEVTSLDDEVGECMRAVEKSGRAGDTIFIFTSEQGPQFPGGKWTCYDLGLRTAFIVRWPGRVRAGSTTDAMVQYVDVLPTLIEAAGGKPGEIDTNCPDANGERGFDGRSFLGVLEGRTNRHSDVVYGVHTTLGIIAGRPYPIRSIRDRRYKYIMNLMPKAKFHNTVIESDKANYWRSWVRDAKRNPRAAKLVERYVSRPAEEFFDLEDDPLEMNNLASDPGHRPRMDAMKKLLLAWMKQQGDLGVETELDAKESRRKRKQSKAK